MISKKWLGGVAGIGVVAATFGFAASITNLNTDAIGGASATVASCTDTVDVSYTVAWNAATSKYEVDEAIVSVAGDIANTCATGDAIDVAIESATGDDTGTAVFGATVNDPVTVTMTNGDIPADAITNVHVAINGVGTP